MLTVYLASVLLAVLTFLLVKHYRRSSLPGPIGLPFLGQSLTLCTIKPKDILPQLKKWRDVHGGIYKLEIVGMIYAMLTEPETVEPVLNSIAHITKGYFEYSFFKPWLNDGLLVSGGKKWHMRRKLLTPSFHFKILENSLNGISGSAEAYVAALLQTGGKAIEIQEIIRSSALKIICETAMGVKLDENDKRQNEYISALKDATEGIVNRYLKFWLFPDFIYHRSKAGKIFFKNIKTMHTFAKQVIIKRKKIFQSEKMVPQNVQKIKNEQKKAFLDLLLDLDDLNQGLFSQADIQEEVDTFMFEGHDTVSAALIFSHFLLANHPEVQEKAFMEQQEIFGDDKRMPTIQDLQRMNYLEMIIKETLRLYPSVPFHSRLLTEDLKIDENHTVYAGQSVVVITYYVHRSSKHWVDPEKFIPERFAPGIERHPFAFIPFSAGPRNCIGQKFAMMELKTMLSTVIRHCKLEAVSTSVTVESLLILKPFDPVIVKVFPRVNSQI